ncbi:histidine kinase [Sphingomonas sp. QA11]|uniref:sensor histidine kinase n=1 Tax=Sphingomonas sp. QA11 TaxID=2950605 RepID=UPI00234AFA2D|nr:histidine kinase [Sphingomonas sp. QA11]WCM27075.1 histidine kinase [Sphingomonas sp. QA11]
MESLPQENESVRAIRRTMIWFILLFWTTQFSILTLMRRLNMGDEEKLSYLLPRLYVTIIAIGLSFVIANQLRRFAGRSMKVKLIAALVAALVGCALHGAANLLIFDWLVPESNMDSFSTGLYVVALLQWFWSYAALCALLVAVTSSLELSDRERRIARLQRIAHAAQLRALRYQLNPHFMFNTLNSIAALISRREAESAEAMVENLADFLRAGLSLDPHEDIPLEKEIELQSLYLSIEELRFPDRLKVEIDVPEDVRSALVPSLVTQPLVENAVRHAVATSLEPIMLRIAARREGEWLRIAVCNSAPVGGTPCVRGTGVGLTNVADRLRARFARNCHFLAERQSDGGFMVTIEIPWSTAG